MGNCHRRSGQQRLPEEQPAAQAARLVAQLDAITTLRRLPARQHPSREPPSSQAAALAALRYRFGCRWHCLHALKVQAAQMGPALPSVKFAFLARRCQARRNHSEDKKLLAYLKELRGE